MNWKKIVTDYFNFTRKDRVGFLIILIFVLFFALSPHLFTKRNAANSFVADTVWINSAKQLEQNNKPDNSIGEDTDEPGGYQFDPSKASKSEISDETLFYFDPNILDKNGWRKLGIRDKTIQTILNYRDKGGRFKNPEDLQRIYGLAKKDYVRLAPYIRIQNDRIQNENENQAGKSSSDKKDAAPNSFARRPLSIDINNADTTAFIALPGIGSKLAARIVNFRDKLGGFYSIEQVGETFGLPDSTFQKIKPLLQLKNSSIRKININTATVDELKAHPYIKYSIANPIVAYRTQHGPFSNIEDIKKVMVVTNEIYNKIAPYLIAQ
jgi:competence protein ComEA